MELNRDMLLECDEKLLISSKPESLLLVERLVEDICSILEIKEEITANILISLTEAVNNAIIHGNQNNPEKTVTIQYEVKPNKITFIVKDEGKGFDNESVPDPTAQENLNKSGGRGIFIMKKLSDHIEFQPPGNVVKMQFNLN
ncbi:MAG: ATP-binding protein [Bacteroidia bacterium]|nr:ATP-binding protein [Bacteroidia bacterium]